jgi:hypothetical protein
VLEVGPAAKQVLERGARDVVGLAGLALVDGRLGGVKIGDPIGTGDGFNTYAFAGGDPIGYSDPGGTNRTKTTTKKKGSGGGPANTKKKGAKTAPDNGGVQKPGKVNNATKGKVALVKEKLKSIAADAKAGVKKGFKKLSQAVIDTFIKNKSKKVHESMIQYNQAHMIKKEHADVTKDFLDVHAWCVRVRGPINTLQMTKDLDVLWDNFFAQDSDVHKGKTVAYEIKRLGKRDLAEAREVVLGTLKMFVARTGYMTWAELLDHRTHFTKSGVTNSLDARLVFEPKRWTNPDGRHRAYHQQKTTRGTGDREYLTVDHWDEKKKTPMKNPKKR